jgi:hypothetical protein
MKEDAMESDHIHRLPDASIDVDYYQARAHQLRSEAFLEFMRPLSALGVGALAATAFTMIFVLGSN